ncbi:MAG: ABC transporter permease subunit [Coriobacteriia bacterium]|nr:ABC transporter permease subunit [Coriobacteriia bacterium]MBN2823438.1 ABC transporter permease subunit [Coriobacteriia bacterium]
MLANVFLKTVRDRWLGWMIALGVVWSFVLLGFAAYSDLDLSILATFPEAYRTMIGLRPGMDAGALSIAAIYGTYGSLTFAAMALAMGAASIAGEERKGTLGLLLANPRSRTHVYVSKVAALVVLTIFATAVMWAISIGTASMMDIALGDLDVMALNVHMLASTLFYGLLAVAIGAATGKRGAASGISTGVLAVGFLGAGLLPLIEGGEKWAKLFPWYYFNGSEPLYNGIEWGHIALLVGAAAVFAVVGLIGLLRRDLKGQSVGVTIIDRLRENPMTKKIADRLAGSARVSSIWLKSASEHQIALVSACSYVFFIQLMLGPFYNALPKEAFEMLAQLPEGLEVLFAFFGGGDMSTPAGFFQIETFGMMAPIMVMLVTIAISSAAVAGEESKRTMGLLLANPITRSRVIAENTWAMVFYASIVGFATFAGTALGALIAGLDMSMWNIAATCVLLTLVGIVGGALALAIGAGTGRKGAAVWGATGVMVALHVLNSIGSVTDGLSFLQRLSPFYYYLGNDPLNKGMDWGHPVVLTVIAAVLIGISFPLFQRRDIRQRD